MHSAADLKFEYVVLADVQDPGCNQIGSCLSQANRFFQEQLKDVGRLHQAGVTPLSICRGDTPSRRCLLNGNWVNRAPQGTTSVHKHGPNPLTHRQIVIG
jgi:hypothetical protein